MDQKKKQAAKKFQIRIYGTGGQGIVAIANIVVTAAYLDGFRGSASHAEYTPAVRNGPVVADMVIAKQKQINPNVVKANLAFIFSSGRPPTFFWETVTPETKVVSDFIITPQENMAAVGIIKKYVEQATESEITITDENIYIAIENTFKKNQKANKENFLKGQKLIQIIS